MKVLPMNVLPRNVSVQKVMRAEYVMLRTPLVLLDERVLVRLGADSKLRTTVEHGISTLDAVAARFLTPPPSSGEEAAPEREETEPEREEIPAEEVHELAEELLEQQEQEHNLAGELAEDEELRRVQAELMAKHRVEEEQETGRGAEPG